MLVGFNCLSWIVGLIPFFLYYFIIKIMKIDSCLKIMNFFWYYRNLTIKVECFVICIGELFTVYLCLNAFYVKFGFNCFYVNLNEDFLCDGRRI